ncbi:MAG: glycosyltransferase [Erythrobacter sp.]
MSMPGTIGAVVYDLRASGVVRNLVRIAESARNAEFDFEIWPLRPQGEFLTQAERVTTVRPMLDVATKTQRDLDTLRHRRTLCDAIRARAPALLFSAGNQMHWHLARAIMPLPTVRRPRFLGRASNAVVSLGQANPLLRAAIKPWERFQYEAMDHVVAVSGELRDQLVHGLGLAADRVCVIPNGIDIERFVDGRGPRTGNDRPLILGIGRLSVQKDFSTLIDAVALVDTEPRPVLRILGRGSDAWNARLRERAQRVGLADRFELLGHVDDVAEHLHRADLFVSSSRWEGASNAMLEALACGTPIVATRAPTGIAEVLKPLGEEWLVPVGDARALAGAITNRLARPRNSEEQAARAHDYNLEMMLTRYRSVFAEQLELALR